MESEIGKFRHEVTHSHSLHFFVCATEESTENNSSAQSILNCSSDYFCYDNFIMLVHWPRGVTVSTLDSESSDCGSNPREAFEFSAISGVLRLSWSAARAALRAHRCARSAKDRPRERT